MLTSRPERPPRMLRNGRPSDAEFSPVEVLYMWCLPEYVDGERLLPPGIKAIRVPNQSVNRGKYSEPEDLYFVEGCPDQARIAQFRVRDIPPPPPILSGTNEAFTFRAEHEPEDDNYAHSEIHAFDENNERRERVPNRVGKMFKQVLSDRVAVISRSNVTQ